jgi:hypothetical protein
MCKQNELETPLCEGSLEVVLKDRHALAYAVLLRDRLDFYRDVKNFHSGAGCGMSVMLADVVDWDEAEKESIRFRLEGDQRMLLKGIARGSAWFSALAAQIGSTLRARKECERVFERSSSRQRHRVSWHDDALSVDAAPQSLSSRSSSGSAADADADAADEEQEARHVLHCGELKHVKRGRAKTRYFILYSDCLEYFSRHEEFVRGESPRCRVVLEDIVGVEISSLGRIHVILFDREFELYACSTEEARRWYLVWSNAFGAGKVPLTDGATVRWVEASLSDHEAVAARAVECMEIDTSSCASAPNDISVAAKKKNVVSSSRGKRKLRR